MEAWEWRNVVLSWLVPSPVKGVLCRIRPRVWPWWCDQELLEAEQRAKASIKGAHRIDTFRPQCIEVG